MHLSAVLVLFGLLEVWTGKYVLFEAYEGQNLTVPFNTNTKINLTNDTIEVKRDEKIVFVLRNGMELPNPENPGKVFIGDADLKQGVVNVCFNNVLPAHRGKYRIYIIELKRYFFFFLDVKLNPAGEASTKLTPQKENEKHTWTHTPPSPPQRTTIKEGEQWEYLAFLLVLVPLIPLLVWASKSKKRIKKCWSNVMRRRAAGENPEPVTFIQDQ